MTLLPVSPGPAVLPAVVFDEGQGARVRRLFPTLSLRHLDPFVVLDDLRVEQATGFPGMPSRGFEAVTYVLRGAFHHQDSLGNDQLIEAGGVQCFTAGAGSRCADRPDPRSLSHGLQLWVNLPGRLRDVRPAYQHAPAAALPLRSFDGVVITTVIGEGSPMSLSSSVRYHDVQMQAGATHVAAIPEGWRGFVYVVQGQVRVGDWLLAPGEAAFPAPGQQLLEARDEARLMLIAGVPHGASVAPPVVYDC
ncbi:MAG: pirin family protein [Deltaproteobacteria bacterium]|nr:pirin family protein [Deltaproteobacteria bacterium]